MVLVTGGDGNLIKIWDMEDGEMINSFPYVNDFKGVNFISWSYDKKLFITGGGRSVVFDEYGKKMQSENLSQSSIGYSGFDYTMKRGLEPHSGSGTCHLSSNNNFSPWRPFSKQIIVRKNDESLLLSNRITGETEKIIKGNSSSKPVDFAWHPSGEFIAVSFEDDDIQIIRVDNSEVVRRLSVQYIVGWNPQGTIFIGREWGEDDFVIWNALEQKEKLMPEEMKDELWFKRFFKNISADGLRYIKIEKNEDYSTKGNIYSVESDELLTTLPEKVTSAAWSPIDGGLLATCGGSETHIWRLDEKSIS